MEIPNVILDRMLELDLSVRELQSAVRQQDRTITGIKHYLKIAADYQNDDPAKVAEAIQAALGHAAKYEGRKQNGKKDRRR